MTLSEINTKLSSYPNSAVQCKGFYCEDWHKVANFQNELIEMFENPKKEPRCHRAKSILLEILQGLENGKVYELGKKYVKKW
jgi:hypothetical protein